MGSLARAFLFILYYGFPLGVVTTHQNKNTEIGNGIEN